jgi:hypothetical protein
MTRVSPQIRVLVPPQPIVDPSDIAGDHDASDPIVAAQISAVTEAIEGPGGWLGRSLGPQTLEASLECWPIFRVRLPYGPVMMVESVQYTDLNGESQALDPVFWGAKNDYFWMKSGTVPDVFDEPFPVQIIYQAGYDGQDVLSGGTGAVPERARQAIILATQDIASVTGAGNMFVKVEEADGVGRTEYVVSDAAGKIVQTACDNLLQTLRVY